MNRQAIALVLMVVGAILLYFGVQAGESFLSETKELFTGTPTDRAVWYYVAGGLTLAAGIGLGIFSRRSDKSQ